MSGDCNCVSRCDMEASSLFVESRDETSAARFILRFFIYIFPCFGLHLCTSFTRTFTAIGCEASSCSCSSESAAPLPIYRNVHRAIKHLQCPLSP